MNTFTHRSLAALSMVLSGIVPVLADQLAKDGEPQAAISEVQLKMSSASADTKGARTESREVMITADSPGFIHLWHYYGDDPLVVPLLPKAGGTSYFRKVAYEARESGGQSGAAVFIYRIIAGPGEKELTRTVELWNHRHISYDDFAKGLRGIQDPSGTCLRGVPLDLAPVGDEALLMEVTDAPRLQQSAPWILKIWRPTYHGRTRLPEELVSLPVQVGYMITTPGAASNRANPPDGQKLGRISQRSGKLVAHLQYQYGSLSVYDGELTLERPFEFDVRAFSGAIFRVVGVLTTQRDSMPFLLRQLRNDLKGTRWETLLNETSSEQGGAGESATRPESDLEGSGKSQPEAEGRSR